jgi:hypothetical protein
MARGGENTGNHFMNISTLTRCPNTNLFKDEKSMLFCVDYSLRPTSSFTTFDSKSFLVCDCQDLNDLNSSTFAATITSIAYGIDVQESDDPYILLAEEALNGINEAAVPGAFWVDLFPILKYVPSWFPGAGFQKKAAHWREVNASVTETPFRYVKEQLVGDRISRSHGLI